MAVAPIPPARRPDLVLAPQGHGTVVKDPHSGAYYQLGPHEAFLLDGLDGRRTAGDLCHAFEQRFREPLAETELDEFVEMARIQGLVGEAQPVPARPPAPAKQNLLYWRKPLLDPDRLFDRLEPSLRFVWTWAFVAVSAAAIVVAGAVLWADREAFAATVAGAVSWETALLAWVAIAAVTTAHEFAHGLTCKHYGGKVHEVGFLLMFFMPCFYCNVSDAWLIPSRWRRAAITAAGMYSDLCVWAAAAFAWRLTPPGTTVSHLAFVMVSVCGVRTLLNANPFLRLDGYYLLSDLLDAPNLLTRAQGHLKGTVRWGLWGAARPPAERHGRVLALYGLATLLFPLSFLLVLVSALGSQLADVAGPAGVGVAAAAGGMLLSAQLGGLFGGEVWAMIRGRRLRTAGWLLALAGGAALLAVWEWEDRAHGSFQLRAAERAELRAEVAGFLRLAHADEGQAVAAGQLVARLEVPHLDSKLAQKRAEKREGEARLKLLQIGPRPEEVAAQRARADRAAEWRELARTDLDKVRQAATADLAKLDKQVIECRAEAEFCRASHGRALPLWTAGAMSREEFDGFSKRKEVAEARLAQAEAARRARAERGTLDAETELARREKGLAEARSTLGLLEAGSRPEEVEAERARVDRLAEEITYLEGLHRKQAVHSPVAGIVCTPRLREAVGRYLREGDPICVIEAPAHLEAEIALAERDLRHVRPGQPVEMKVQMLPLETFTGKVDRVAPRATAETDPAQAAAAVGQNRVTVYCRLDQPGDLVRPGMTGQARISCGQKPLGVILGDRAMRLVRTEFWWW